MKTKRLLFFLAPALLSAALLFGACGDDDNKETDNSDFSVQLPESDTYNKIYLGQVKKISYNALGYPSKVEVKNIPAGWHVSVNQPEYEITITCNTDFPVGGKDGVAKIVASKSGKSDKEYDLVLECDASAGAPFYDGTIARGLIIRAKTASAPGMVIHQSADKKAWSTVNLETGANSLTDGKANTQTIYDNVELNYKNNCPMFYDCFLKGTEWYVPSVDDMKVIYELWNGSASPTADPQARSAFNKKLREILSDYTGIVGTEYKTSTESSTEGMEASSFVYIQMNDGETTGNRAKSDQVFPYRLIRQY